MSKIPLAHELRMEVAAELADAALWMYAEREGVPRDRLVWVVSEEGSTAYTEEGQHTFDSYHAAAESALDHVLGEETEDEILGHGPGRIGTLDNELIKRIAMKFAEEAGEPAKGVKVRPGQKSLARLAEEIMRGMFGGRE